MIIKVTPAILDHWSEWDSNWYPAPAFDVEGYQKQINQICGLSRGKPIVRLEWGGTEYEMVNTEWIHGTPIKTEKRPKHKLLQTTPFGFNKEIPIRRWILTERCEPEQYMDVDTSFVDSDGYRKEKLIKPKDGYYLPLVYIGNHSKCPKDCCERDNFCYGDYKQPSQDELDWLRGAWHTEFLNKQKLNPKEAMSKNMAEKIATQATKDTKEKQENAEREHRRGWALDWFRTHGHNLSQSTVSNGKYMFNRKGLNYGDTSTD